MTTEPKTQKNDGDVQAFLESVTDPQRRGDAKLVCELMTKVTGEQPVMWGSSIVGYGSYHYKYSSGREADWPAIGFSPRKGNLTLYLASQSPGYDDFLTKLGPHTTSKACLYIKRLGDINITVLEEMIRQSFAHMNGRVVTN